MLDLTNPVTLTWFIVIVALWQAPWKAVALWKSARNSHLIWFIVFCFVNLLAIPEIIYIFGFSKKKRRR